MIEFLYFYPLPERGVSALTQTGVGARFINPGGIKRCVGRERVRVNHFLVMAHNNLVERSLPIGLISSTNKSKSWSDLLGLSTHPPYMVNYRPMIISSQQGLDRNTVRSSILLFSIRHRDYSAKSVVNNNNNTQSGDRVPCCLEEDLWLTGLEQETQLMSLYIWWIVYN